LILINWENNSYELFIYAGKHKMQDLHHRRMKMKKRTLLFVLLIACVHIYAQTNQTGIIAGIVQELMDNIGKPVPKDADDWGNGVFVKDVDNGYGRHGALYRYSVRNGNVVDVSFIVPFDSAQLAALNGITWTTEIGALSGARKNPNGTFLYRGYIIMVSAGDEKTIFVAVGRQ
jgi:hypothetical protein